MIINSFCIYFIDEIGGVDTHLELNHIINHVTYLLDIGHTYSINMKKFYIIYKDGTNIEGELCCFKKEFIIKLINPNIDDIYTYQIWDVEEEVADCTPDYLSYAEQARDREKSGFGM